MADLPIIISPNGLMPQSPAALRAQLVASVSAINPDYTSNLPGTLVEDIASTDVGAIVLCDTALVETINSLTPFGANPWLLLELGELYGVPPGVATNTNVFLVFTGPPGYVIAKGFTVSDVFYQYVVQDGGIIGADGTSIPLFAVAALSGSWAIPSGTVQSLITSVPTVIQQSTTPVTVNNPLPGNPQTEPETQAAYRARVWEAGLAASMGMGRYLRTLLTNIEGVVPRLVSVVQQQGQWEVICGGGDPYQVAYAIWQALFDISALSGSILAVAGVTNANPGVVTTTLNHGFVSGQQVTINGMVGMTPLNNVLLNITVLTPTTFSVGVDTTGYAPYVSGGVVTPNLRNQVISINDYPDTYVIPYVVPPLQTVSIVVMWNTTSPNFINPVGVAQLGSQAIADYVNSVVVGQPMILYQLEEAFSDAISTILPKSQLTRMVFSVSINGIGVPPEVGTGIIAGDPESYFETTPDQIAVIQG